MQPASGRSRIVRTCKTTSVRNRLTRKGTLSIENVFGAAAISWTRRATCSANAPTNARNSSQKTRVANGSVLHGLDDCRNDLEQVSDDPVVRDLENRRVGVLVDRHDGVRAFHADQMLNRARDAERDIELRRDGLPGAADLPLHREPAGVADRTRRRDLGA